MKRFLLPLALCALAAVTFVRADMDFLEIPADGSAVEVRPGGKIVWVDAVSTNSAWSPTVKLARELWTDVAQVETSVATNFTYSYVVTNAPGTVTNVYPRPFPALPARTAAFWTNAVEVTTVATNLVPRLSAAETNAVVAGTSYAAPGDKLLLSGAAPDRSRVTVAVER